MIFDLKKNNFGKYFRPIFDIEKFEKSSVGGKQCILLRNCLHFTLRTDFGSPGGPRTRIATPTGSVGTAWVHLASGDVVGEGNSRHELERGVFDRK